MSHCHGTAAAAAAAAAGGTMACVEPLELLNRSNTHSVLPSCTGRPVAGVQVTQCPTQAFESPGTSSRSVGGDAWLLAESGRLQPRVPGYFVNKRPSCMLRKALLFKY
ncbi:hypothetical protein E2C01_062229 [Portunus trituberculatus]|uniref:Uncharacterized protein n=1 Tax=Portunus trituberculatus TaxID=210409 RepID=A0A5B7HE00_PORTR|nr:hypothetical protein [Portunus trituberculatus]